MRIKEILNESLDLELLAKEIQAGESPTIVAATYARGQFAWGDLEKLGWAERHRRRVSGTIWEVAWEYTGPNSITVHTYGAEPYVLHTGERTPAVEVDYE